jgi:hypothetical protein
MGAQKSIGTKLQKTSGTPGYIANLTSISEVGIESSDIDITTLDSPNSYKEYLPGFKDGGEVAIKGIIKSEVNMDEMLDLADAQTSETWAIEFPSGAKWFFGGYLKSWKEAESTVEGVRGFTGSIRISGKPTYSPTGVSA